MESKASLKFFRISPQKARLVANLIRGRDINEAINVLRFTDKKGARAIVKLLESAVANAEQTGEIDIDTLYVKEITVDKGATMTRHRPRAQGRATPILKRSSHIQVVLDER